MSAEDNIKAYYARWERLEEAKKAASDDLKEFFSETKHAGFDNKALRIAFNTKAKAETETEGDRALAATVDVYLSALEAPSRASRACARENIEKFATDGTKYDATSGEILDDAPRADGGANIVTKHTEIATNEGGATETNPEAGHGAGNSPLIEPSGPDVNGHPNSPEEATKSGVGPLPGAAGADGTHEPAEDERDVEAAGGAALVLTNSESDGIRYEATPPMPMKSLPYAACFPELSKAEYDSLTSVIKLQGVMEPIVRMGDVILNGWNRYNIARSLGIEYPVVSYYGNDVLLDVIRWQREDRAWTSAQEQKIAARLAKEVSHRASDIMRAFQIEEEFA